MLRDRVQELDERGVKSPANAFDQPAGEFQAVNDAIRIDRRPFEIVGLVVEHLHSMEDLSLVTAARPGPRSPL